MDSRNIRALILCIASVFVAEGCDERAPERVPIAGTVLIDGEPLTTGTIRFVPASGRPASSAILADGSFVLAAESVDRVTQPGVPPGEYRVQIASSVIVDDETIRWNVPQKYADFRTSGLVVNVAEPAEDLLIELSWSEDENPDSSDESGAAGTDQPVDSEADDSTRHERSEQ